MASAFTLCLQMARRNRADGLSGHSQDGGPRKSAFRAICFGFARRVAEPECNERLRVVEMQR